MAGLMALVASLLTRVGFLGAVAGEVAVLATVVALGAVDTVTRHVANTTARVAGFLAPAAITAAITTTTTTTIAAITTTAAIVAAFGAVAGDVADLTALVAFLAAGAAAIITATTTGLGAVTRDVARLSASVAGLRVLMTFRAVTAHMAFVTAVVTFSRATGRAVTGLMSSLATVVASAALIAVAVHD